MLESMWRGGEAAMLEVDAGGRILRVNEACRVLLGERLEPFTRESHEPDALVSALKALAPERPVLCVVLSSSPARAEEGEADKAAGIRLRAVLEQTVEAVVLTDSQGVIETVNPAALRMFGYAENELLGRRVHILTPPEVRKRHREFMGRLVAGADPAVIGREREAYAMRKDGQTFPVELSVSAVHAQGRSFYTAIVRDITLRKEREAQLMRLNARLSAKQKILAESLAAAAEVHRSLLPRCGECYAGVDLAWIYMPSETLGGDMLGVVELGDDARRLGVYVIDVAGHGVPAALVCMAVIQELQNDAGIVYDGAATSPAHVLKELDRRFPLRRFGRHCTIFYGVLDTWTGEMVYSSAGHPLACVARGDGALVPLERGGTILGLGAPVPYEEGRATLDVGDKLVIYTDGVTELEDAGGEQFGAGRLAALLRELRHADARETTAALLKALRAHAELPAPDDVSALVVGFTGTRGEDAENV